MTVGHQNLAASVLRFLAPGGGEAHRPLVKTLQGPLGEAQAGPTKSHVRELGGRPPSLVQPSLQRKSPGQNCDHSL